MLLIMLTLTMHFSEVKLLLHYKDAGQSYPAVSYVCN